ncbi:unnamed protein product [Lactuca saligna]|uniref:Helitron helicase-like domain-containing protein n=1 Tax=Lactuca saligna TaxID=75948 RepID=A0AA35Z2N3_LACSI|nr:unnamed protein product [Lactuca saligna]
MPNVVANQMNINEGTTNDVVRIEQMRKIHNKKYYERRKELSRRQIMRDHMLQQDPYTFVYDGMHMEHNVLKVQNACVHCRAKRFQFEFPSFCCMSGNTKLAFSDIHEELRNLYTSNSELSKMFRHNIRAYNTDFSFASMGVDMDKTMTNMISRNLTKRSTTDRPHLRSQVFGLKTAQDRPDLVSRVFHAELEYLKKQLFTKHILGTVGAYIYVIEFQKRGLPHAHFLMIMRPPHKLTNTDHYDKIVCAEIPDPKKYPKMHELVISHMIHSPCSTLNSDCPCMKNEQKKCCFRYPRQFNETTLQGKDSYLVYQRRDNGIEVDIRGNKMDNRWVVTYNPKLLMMFNCHMNVEFCSSITFVKYVFKYIYKGHDKQVINIDLDGQPVVVNEIKRFQDA